MLKVLSVVVIAAGLGACATIPTPLQGEYAPTKPRTAPSAGQSVRWGGEIIKVEPKANSTCIEVLARELGPTARPIATDRSDGRFFACQAGFIEPGDYPNGREVTVIGRVDGTINGRIGEFDYVYPRVEASTVYLWPRRVERVATYGPGFNDPFWGSPWGWGGGFGGYYGNYWGGPRPVIIVKPRPAPPPPRNR